MPQSAIRVAQSLQRNHTWEALAPPEELRRRKHMKKCDWRVLATGVPTSRQLVMPDSAFPDALKFQLSVMHAMSLSSGKIGKMLMYLIIIN